MKKTGLLLCVLLLCCLAIFVGCTTEEGTPTGSDTETADPFENEHTNQSVGLAYEVNPDGTTCTITGMGTCTATELVIPQEIDGYRVTGIGERAFECCTGLTSITIPDSVTSIGAGAFAGCTGLTSITIPDSMTSIGIRAFQGCTGLTSLTIPFVGATKDGTENTHFGYIFGASSYSIHANYVPASLQTVIITGGTSIGSFAFQKCTNLTNITIPASVTSIGAGAFAGCTGLTSITIPDSVTSIGIRAFQGCTGLTSLTIPFVGATKDGTENTHFGYIFGASSYSIHANYVPASLQTVIITGGTSIGSFAFQECTNLTNITIPASVTSIDSTAFSDCTGLTGITVQEGNPNYHSAGNCLIETESKTLVAGCQSSAIPTDGSVTSIGGAAFMGCKGLTSLTIPDSVTSIGDWAFYRCSGLTSVTIPDSVTSIGAAAFYWCSGLTSITIPDSVTSIGDIAFHDCTGLMSLTVQKGNLNYHSAGNCIIETQSKTLVVGCQNSIIPTDGSVTSIGYSAFSGCTGLTSIVIPDSVTSIGAGAFECCTGLTSITIPDSVTSIGIRAFECCTGLTSITIPDSVTTLGSCAFSSCHKLSEVTLGTSLRDISEYAFDYCTELMSITIPDNVTSIGDWAFHECTGLTNITIPDSVTSIGVRAFYECTGLTSITIPDSVTSIGENAFNGCTNLDTVYYTATAEEWSAITVGANNDLLTTTTVYYYSETQPTESGNYWRYVDGVPTAW